MAITTTQAQQLYIAYFGRPADPSGLGFWTQGDRTNTMQQQSNAFATAPEWTIAISGLTNDQIVNLIYINAFGRAPEPAGLRFWSDAITTNVITVGTAAYQIVANAGFADTAIMAAKVTATMAYTTAVSASTIDSLAYNNPAAFASANSWLDGISTAAQASVAILPPTLIPSLDAMVVASNSATSTITLTTSFDAITFGSKTKVIGTVSDAFGGVTTQTLNWGDTIVGTGTNNTLLIFDSATLGGTNLAGVTLSGVQTVQVQNTVGIANKTYDFAAITGVTTVQNENSVVNAVTRFTDLTAGTVVSVSGASSGAGTTQFTYASASSPITVNLNGGLTAIQTIINIGASTATTATLISTGGVNGMATNGQLAKADINLTGSAGTLTTLNVNATTDIYATLNPDDFTATGAALTVTGSATSVFLGKNGVYRTIDASGLFGGLTVNASATLTIFKGGLGNDSLTKNHFGTDAFPGTVSTASIDADTGIDSVDATLIDASNAAVFRNFEILSFLQLQTTLDVSLLTNSTITGAQIGGIAAAVAAGLTNLVETATGFNVIVSTSSASATTSTTNLGFTAQSIAGTTDVLNYSFAGTSGFAITGGVVTHQGIELVNIASNGISGTANQLTIIDTALQSVRVTGTVALTLTVTDQAVIGLATTTALSTINASGMAPASSTSGLTLFETIGAAAAGTLTGLNITGSSANDSLTVITNSGKVTSSLFGADTVNLASGGNDTVVVTGAISQLATGASATAFAFTTVNGANTGDTIGFGGTASMVIGTTAVNVSATVSLLAAVNTATGAVGAITWFQFSGNTYIVDNVATAGFDAADIVVQLTGLNDLSTSFASTGLLLIA